MRSRVRGGGSRGSRASLQTNQEARYTPQSWCVRRRLFVLRAGPAVRLTIPECEGPRSSSQPYGGVALQDGTLLGPILHHDFSVPVGARLVIQNPRRAASHIPRATSWARISVIQSTPRTRVLVDGGSGTQLKPTGGHGRPASLQCMRSLTHACLCCRSPMVTIDWEASHRSVLF